MHKGTFYSIKKIIKFLRIAQRSSAFHPGVNSNYEGINVLHTVQF